MQPVVGTLSRNPVPEREVGRILAWHEAVAEVRLEFAQLLKSYAPRISLACPPVKSNTLKLSNTLRCYGTWLSFLMQLVVAALSRNPLPERGVGRIPCWHEAVAEVRLEFAQLLKSYAPISLACPPVESNTLELSNTLRCYVTWLSFLMQPAVIALIVYPLPELWVGSVLLWHEAVAELRLEFAQLLKSYAPRISLVWPPVETNSIERSNTLSWHRTRIPLLVQPVGDALSQNPIPELGVGRILAWHAAVTELHLELAQLSELVAPLRVTIIISCCFKSPCIKTLLFLVLAFASSLLRSLFGFLFVTLAHGGEVLMLSLSLGKKRGWCSTMSSIDENNERGVNG